MASVSSGCLSHAPLSPPSCLCRQDKDVDTPYLEESCALIQKGHSQSVVETSDGEHYSFWADGTRLKMANFFKTAAVEA